ncbi:Protein of unknown function [Gryllus bimaculatus]|nr:Protein of unknown function [Gryllus bimaculatus]
MTGRAKARQPGDSSRAGASVVWQLGDDQVVELHLAQRRFRRPVRARGHAFEGAHGPRRADVRLRRRLRRLVPSPHSRRGPSELSGRNRRPLRHHHLQQGIDRKT